MVESFPTLARNAATSAYNAPIRVVSYAQPVSADVTYTNRNDKRRKLLIRRL